MKIIGIGGTNGSGKDTLAAILEEQGWFYVSVSEILRDELQRRRQPIERGNLRDLSAEWRREFGPGYLMDAAVKIFQKAAGSYKGLVISSLRNFGEADRVHELGGKVVWLDADPKLRYQRIYSRQRSSEDQKTFEQFLSEEEAERNHSADEATLNWQGVKDRADVSITNNQNDIEKFKQMAQKALSL